MEVVSISNYVVAATTTQVVQQQVPITVTVMQCEEDPYRHLSHLRPMKFLLVDDEPMNLMALEGMLEIYGIGNIVKAFNGKQALDVMRNRQYDFDFIMTDFHMPLMNGVELAKEVRGLQDRGTLRASARILLASGQSFAEGLE